MIISPSFIMHVSLCDLRDIFDAAMQCCVTCHSKVQDGLLERPVVVFCKFTENASKEHIGL